MTNHLFRDYLIADDQYKLVQQFWCNVMDEITRSAGQAGEWKPWKLRTFVDGTSLPLDVCSIFDAYNSRLGKAITILQSPAETDNIEISAWIDSFDFSDSGGPGPARELIINLALSEESAVIAQSLLELWVKQDMSPEIMQQIINKQLGSESN